MKIPSIVFTALLPLICHGAAPWFGIRVVDEATGDGVPLAEMKTVNEIASITDSAGWIAFNEPGLMDREVFFHIASPGYELPQDGFGFRGAGACRGGSLVS